VHNTSQASLVAQTNKIDLALKDEQQKDALRTFLVRITTVYPKQIDAALSARFVSRYCHKGSLGTGSA
jgi:hypothetical protein